MWGNLVRGVLTNEWLTMISSREKKKIKVPIAGQDNHLQPREALPSKYNED